MVEEHTEAVEYDLIGLGLRLRNVGSDDFSWGDLLAIVRQAPQSSALFRAQHPEDFLWTQEAHLLAAVADALHIANWQRGGKGKRPEPITRPGVGPEKTRFGKGAIPFDEMADWLGWN